MNRWIVADLKLINTPARPRRWKSESTTPEIRQTPLHLAVKKANLVAVQMLLEAGADRSIKDDGGLLAAEIATNQLSQGSTSQRRRKAHQNIVCLLEGRDISKVGEPDVRERLSSRLRELMM